MQVEVTQSQMMGVAAGRGVEVASARVANQRAHGVARARVRVVRAKAVVTFATEALDVSLRAVTSAVARSTTSSSKRLRPCMSLLLAHPRVSLCSSSKIGTCSTIRCAVVSELS